jgi:hypothetical protein
MQVYQQGVTTRLTLDPDKAASGRSDAHLDAGHGILAESVAQLGQQLRLEVPELGGPTGLVDADDQAATVQREGPGVGRDLFADDGVPLAEH